MIDLFIILAFVIYCVVNGFLNQKKASQGLEEYFLGGRTLKGWQAGFSMAATQFAADTPLLVTGLIATAGIFSLWRLWIYAFAFLMMGFVLGACWRRSGILTDAEFTELRYGGEGAHVLRVLKGVYMGTIVNCAVLAMVLVAAVRICEPFLFWHEWLPAGVIQPVTHFLQSVNFSLTSLPDTDPAFWIRSTDNVISIAMILGFTALYSMTGGLRSVVATDVLQFSIAIVGTFAYAWIAVSRVGGLAQIPAKLTALYGAAQQEKILSFAPASWDSISWVLITVIAVQWFAQVNADGTGYLAQRTMGCKTDNDAKWAAVIFTFGQILVRSLLWLVIGVGLLIIYPAESMTTGGAVLDGFRVEREMTFVYGMRDILPVGVRGLMLTGMLAALASTVDTHLNWGASYWANDIYRGWLMKRVFKREASGRELVWVARVSCLFILVIATLVAANLGSIQKAWHLTLLFGSGLGVVLILRWLWYRINLWSEVSAIAVSLALSFYLLTFTSLEEGVRLLIMLGVSTAVMLAVTLLTPAEDTRRLVDFYRQVRPPGFWQPIARLAGTGDDCLKRLKRSAAATLLCGISVLALLTGTGRLMLAGSGQGVSLGLIAGGFILIPVWWRLGFRQ